MEIVLQLKICLLSTTFYTGILHLAFLLNVTQEAAARAEANTQDEFHFIFEYAKYCCMYCCTSNNIVSKDHSITHPLSSKHAGMYSMR